MTPEQFATLFADARTEFLRKLKQQNATPRELEDARAFADMFFEIVAIKATWIFSERRENIEAALAWFAEVKK